MIFLILNFGTKFGNYLWRHNVNQIVKLPPKNVETVKQLSSQVSCHSKNCSSLCDLCGRKNWPSWFVVDVYLSSSSNGLKKINLKRHLLQLMWNRANRLKSGGTPLGESTFGRKDRNSYIRTHAIGASKDSSPVILTSFLVNLCLRARGDGCIYCCTPGIHWADWEYVSWTIFSELLMMEWTRLKRSPSMIAYYQQLVPRKLNWLSRHTALRPSDVQGGWMPPPYKVFPSFFLEDKT